MHLISRVKKSDVINARRHIVSPVMQLLLIFSATVYIGVGIACYIKDRDLQKFLMVTVMFVFLLTMCYSIPYLIAVGNFERMRLLFGTDVLNFHLYFGDAEIRITDISNQEVGRIDYADVRKCVVMKSTVVMLAGCLTFVFDRQQALQAGLFDWLKSHGIISVFRIDCLPCRSAGL